MGREKQQEDTGEGKRDHCAKNWDKQRKKVCA
jgi:hypothetical protein